MSKYHNFMQRPLSRREMLGICKGGFGTLAFASLFGGLPLVGCDRPKKGLAASSDLYLGPHYLPKAKNVIFLYMDGGVSQVDSFDPKPRLAKENGEDPRKKFKVDNTQFDNVGKILKSPWDFKQYGECGMPVSELFPHIATCVDDLALIRSMTSNFPEHTNANYFLHTGSGIQGRPSMGSWMTYGLGSENKNIPGYVVLDGGLIPPGGLDNFKNGFLPASYQASVLRAGAEPVANIRPQESIQNLQEQKLGFIKQLDQNLIGKMGEVDAVESAISNYELAYKMQSSIPELTEFGAESEATKKLYGLDSDDPHTKGYASQCLLARRLVERGVRFIELTCPNVGADRWDQHSNLKQGHERNAHAVDQPIAGLLKDLKSRGLLEETLVVWTGEFGRTPFAQGSNGRDHNPSAFSMWMAGAGIKGGTIFGKTDDYGYRVIENEVTIHDLHATIMHLLGLNHEQLTFRFGGRDMRLTDVHGHVIKDILA
ncbi:DUF1501 domain-containing protein [Kriegella aquimaris]|uniref:Tat (Twin-arginine translocation) pathway signal sequence n=1 Tax=Kriegella aquimaris TaxID=192904 RepID=A0A1G9SNF9_9FLAO|nr:DUF1501 domain-containing protein [Kriegella aquimaris]SDM37006.1 Protein of unknown function [Kriegella aquimaris]